MSKYTYDIIVTCNQQLGCFLLVMAGVVTFQLKSVDGSSVWAP